MGMSMSPLMDMSMRLTQTYDCTIDEIITLLDEPSKYTPLLRKGLEDYFSPAKSGSIEKEFEKYLKHEMYMMKNNDFSRDNYIALTLSFQFTSPLLGLMKQDETGIYVQYKKFQKLLKEKYDLSDPRMKFDIREDVPESFLDEHDALDAYSDDLEENFGKDRNIKESVQDRLRQDGNNAVKLWQNKCKSQDEASLAALSEAFGRCVVIPTFFSYKDKKLLNFYHESTKNIKYYIEIPEQFK